VEEQSMSEYEPGPAGAHENKHPHLHAVGHALATAGEVYGQVLASLVTSRHHPSWEQAVREYDRTHPAALPEGPHLAGRGPAGDREAGSSR
jgi:hypothetical protein